MTRDAPEEAFRSVRFVIFNYDRCLEQFLFLALQAHFDIDSKTAGQVLADVPFLHPYGSLGPLPWQTKPQDAAVPLGGADGLDPFEVGNRLRTFTESVESEESIRIKDAIANSWMILMLGFGYLDQNVSLLTPAAERSAGRCISTAFGISEPGYAVIQNILRRLAERHSERLIESGTCSELFKNFDMKIRF